MHAFTLKYPSNKRRIIGPVRIAEAFDPVTSKAEDHRHIEVEACWDTGAMGSVILASVARGLGLIPSGRHAVTGVHGAKECASYVVNIVIPPNVGVSGVQVVETDALQGCQALIGMDIIQHGDLAVTASGNQTWVSFRIPHGPPVDYVADIERSNARGLGRNAPCWCGAKHPSGRQLKFKECHGK